MQTIDTNQLWQPKAMNQSGIRRLKIADARGLAIIPSMGLVPQDSFTFYEFIFPFDLSCIATFQSQLSQSGALYWSPSISFILPHLADDLAQWAADQKDTQWIAITEDYNNIARVFGGVPEGLNMAFQASTGDGPTSANPMSISLSGDQLLPFLTLPSYEDAILFPNTEFDYGFNSSFS